MPNEIRSKPITSPSSFTITLASLANGSGRQTTLLSNSSNYPRVMVYLRIKSGSNAPTAGATYDVYLIRRETASTPSYATDNAGASDAAITIENALLIGSIVVTNTANKNFYGEWMAEDPGPNWGIAIVNRSGQALSSTEADHLYMYQYFVPEVQ